MEILKENEGGRSVLISRDMSRDGEHYMETIAIFNESLVTLIDLHTYHAPKKFELTPEEMETLFQAWQQFKADQGNDKKAGELLMSEALAIAAAHPAIQVQPLATGWGVSIPAHGIWFKKPCATPEALLLEVKNALAILQQRKKQATSSTCNA